MKRRKVKNFILKAITAVATFTFLLGACSLDSVSTVPMVMCAGSLLWLIPFAFANREVCEDASR